MHAILLRHRQCVFQSAQHGHTTDQLTNLRWDRRQEPNDVVLSNTSTSHRTQHAFSVTVSRYAQPPRLLDNDSKVQVDKSDLIGASADIRQPVAEWEYDLEKIAVLGYD